MTERPAETLVTTAALRALTGAAPGEIEALVKSKLIAVSGGKTSLVPAIRAYLDQIRSTARSASLAAAQDAARSARADAAELALAIDARRLVRDADAQDAIAHVCGTVMRTTYTIAARATRDIRERRAIEAAVNDMQLAIARDVRNVEAPVPAVKPSRRRKS